MLAPLAVLATLVLGTSPSAGEPVAGGLIFPQRSVELSLLVDSSSRDVEPTPPGGVLLQPKVTLDDGSAPPVAVKFSLSSPIVPSQYPALPWLHVDSKTGAITVKRHRVVEDTGSPRVFVLWLEATARLPPAAPHRAARPFMVPASTARMNITLTLVVQRQNDTCAQPACKPCHDVCFWERAEYQVWENMPATRMGPIGNPRSGYSCQTPTTYKLINGSELAEVREEAGQWSLWTRENLDRDRVSNASAQPPQRGPGPALYLDIQCHPSSGTPTRSVVKVHVLDEDDNAPQVESGSPNVSFNFQTEADLSRGAHFAVRDLDSRSANRFSGLNVSDPKGVVTHKKLEFDVTHAGVQQTLISIRLQLKEPSDAPYSIGLGLTDLSLKEGLEKELHVNATLWGPPVDPPVAMSRSVALGQPHPISRKKRATAQQEVMEAPKPESGPHSLWRGAARFARVATLGHLGDETFYSLIKDPTGAFDITNTEGIVFLDKPPNLKRQRGTIILEVAEKRSSGRTVQMIVRVQVVNAPGPGQGQTACTDTARHCADHDSEEACVAACGLGSGGSGRGPSGGCSWRPTPEEVNPNSTRMTKSYATCSSNKDTCPDTFCDALEAKDLLICPQDCTDGGKVMLGVPCNTTGTVPRGVCMGSRACVCHSGGACQCGVSPYPLRARGKGRPERTKAREDEVCGNGCKAAIMVAIVAAVLAVAAWASWQRRTRAKRAGSGRGLDADRGGTTMDLLPRRSRELSGGALGPVGPAGPAGLTAGSNRAIDERWEISRDCLQLHEEIGSGEFGRVLRGSLKKDGQEVWVTVAVKTVRDESSSSELRDLLSEYELLKDVDHPNVVRLLGACTAGGGGRGPVAIVLEYCHLGSLRGFLHKCRWLEGSAEQLSERKPNHPDDDKPFMTPRKVIGFAWQIAKGMDYLSQLKLVHRDLASRNVLLNADQVCKISDFGLTRDVYVDEAYCKHSAGKVKWLAPESLLMRVYTSKSDVWSFGVLLWELASLGDTPYAGVPAHDILALLASGQRLAPPEHCSRELYRVMKSCWSAEPQERPNFSQLVSALDGMLSHGSGYMDLDARIVTNPSYFMETPQTLPLPLLCSPCEGDGYLRPKASDSPVYQNSERK